MRTRRNKRSRRSKTKKIWISRGGKKSNKSKKSKKWTTAISAAQKTLSKTGDVSKAQKVLKIQALANARKLFGYSSKQMHK